MTQSRENVKTFVTTAIKSEGTKDQLRDMSTNLVECVLDKMTKSKFLSPFLRPEISKFSATTTNEVELQRYIELIGQKAISLIIDELVIED